MRPFFFHSAVVLALGLPACQGGDAVAPMLPASVNHCATNADCAGSVCDTTRHACVAVARADVFFLATPTQGISATAFPTVTAVHTPRSGDTVDLDLHAPHTVYGEVLAPDPTAVIDPTHPDQMADARPIDATVQFIPSGQVLGTAVQVTASSAVSAPINHDATGYSFTALLSDGMFDVLVVPSPELSGTIPPWFQQAFDVRTEVPVQRYDLRYPVTYDQWAGVLTDRSGQPLPGLTLQAVDTTRSSLQVSTVATTDATGAFSLRIAPGAPDAWTLQITSATGAHAQLTVDIPRAVLERSGYPSRALRVAVPLSTSLLPVLGAGGGPGGALPRCAGCVAVHATVEGHGASDPAVPVRGADVRLHAPLAMPDMDPSVTAWYEAHAETASDGSFSASLAPGTYDVVVTPQDGVFGNAIRRSFGVRSDVQQQAGQVFALDPRLPLAGRVLTSAGAPVHGARVTAVPFANAYLHSACLDDPDLAALAPLSTTVDGATAADGTYALAVNPGLYRILVEPPDGAGFPATLSATICVASRVQAFDVTLDAPVAVHGTVRDAAHHPVPGATVEGLIRVSEPGAVGVVLRVGRTVTAADGTYATLLPDSTSIRP